jgi:hypothetical protein
MNLFSLAVNFRFWWAPLKADTQFFKERRQLSLL